MLSVKIQYLCSSKSKRLLIRVLLCFYFYSKYLVTYHSILLFVEWIFSWYLHRLIIFWAKFLTTTHCRKNRCLFRISQSSFIHHMLRYTLYDKFENLFYTSSNCDAKSGSTIRIAGTFMERTTHCASIVQFLYKLKTSGFPIRICLLLHKSIRCRPTLFQCQFHRWNAFEEISKVRKNDVEICDNGDWRNSPSRPSECTYRWHKI